MSPTLCRHAVPSSCTPRPPVLRRFVWLPVLLALMLFISGPARAESEAPDETSLQSQLDATKANSALSEADRQRRVEQLQLALEWTRRAKQVSAQTQQEAQEVADAPAERRRLLNLAVQLQASTEALDAALAQAEPELIEQRRGEAQARVNGLQTALSQVRADLAAERKLELTSQIDAAQDLVDRTSYQSSDAALSSDDNLLSDAAVRAARAEAAYRLADLARLRQRLADRPGRIALLEARATLLEAQLNAAQSQLSQLEELLNSRRQSGVSETIAQARTTLAELTDAPAEVVALASRNVALTEELAALYRQRAVTEQDRHDVEQAISALERKFDSLNRLLELKQLESSVVFGTALRREWDKAGRQVDIELEQASASQAMTNSRIAMFDIDEGRGNYEQPRADEVKAVAPLAMQPTIDALLKRHAQLLQTLSSTYGQEVDGLSILLDQRRYLASRSVDFSELLKSHLFWIPSAPVFGMGSVNAVEMTMAWLIEASKWHLVRDAMLQTVRQRPVRVGLLFALLLGAVFIRRKVRERLTAMIPLIGKVRTDRFRLTMRAFFYTFVLALPPAMLMFLLADLTARNVGFTGSLSVALATGGAVLLFMDFMLQLVRPGGLAEAHFRWQRSTVELLRHNNGWLVVLFVLVTTVMVLLTGQASPDLRDGLGRVALLVLCLAIFATALRVARAYRRMRRRDGLPFRAWYQAHPANPIFRIFPIALIVMSLLGYHYTASELLALVIRSMFVITLAVLVYYTLERAFAIYERRLALERLIERRAQSQARSADRDLAEKAGADFPDIIDNEIGDRQTITSQTRTLLRLIVVSGLLAALFMLWRDLLPVGRALDDLVLWQIHASSPGQASQVITLWNALVALAVLLGSFVAVRNLPGALEIALLSRLDLAPGSGYAITTVLKYLIVFVGLIWASNLIGADWSRLQWLVAALSVGLGFGLQEIVANFVSGIVILFERPFRLGDTITIDEHSGTVTRIRTRATTISDWDRKEIIIPNKTFITGQFINWTLADSVTRLVVPVGVAYGSDTDEVVKLLTEIARDNPTVMDEPLPAVLFVGFGESSLNFELRIFTRSLVDRVILTHEIHMAIERVFRQRGIEIAFPQRDVHLDTSRPLDVVLHRPPAPG